jgi:hypothetical protein
MEQLNPQSRERVADMLDAASRRSFIGRSAELAVFDGLLDRLEHVGLLWICGPGGVGKTALRSGSTPSPCGTIPRPFGNLAKTPCTRPRSERCSSPTLVRRFTPVSGFLIISIRAGSGVPGAERSSTSIVPTHPARVVSRCRRDAAISKPELSESQWAIAL